MTSPRLTRLTAPLAFLLSSTAIVVVFWGFLYLDLPIARFVRSVHVPWLEFLGDAAHYLGKGEVLAGVSLVLLGFGWLRQNEVWRRAGLEGFLAYLLVGTVGLLLKHLIGRPRPRLMHANGFEFGPSWQEGFDSFPSGHTSASFAVATVLSRHFPRAGWLFYFAAVMVGLSRVVRGSHFPTDVIAGVILGVTAGSVMINPLREWRRSIAHGWAQLAPYLVGAFALFWTAFRLAPVGWANLSTMVAGTTLMLLGVGLRVYQFRSRLVPRLTPSPVVGSQDPGVSPSGFEIILIAIGLALTTGSMLITILAAFVMAGRWLAGLELRRDPETSTLHASHPATEIGFVLALGAAVVVIQALKGLLPLLY
jgi:membrane-associated phospholipid phosphatase